ncbi:MAG: bile acid:sodium symporter [Deltaproteobacteria bacterium]|nr:bile acid:sodium symporter [Deltaproteobacteria bacterium]
MPPRSLLARAWLPVAIVLAAAAGLVWPDPGRWMADARASTWLVPVVMLLVSLRVPGRQLVEAVRHPLALLAGLVLTFGLFPPVALGWQALIGPPGDEARTALVILAAQPSTLATAAVLTQLAGGNAALAVVCTVTSQLVSIVATPWILALYVGRAVPVDAWALTLDLLRAVLVPVLLGQLLRPLVARWAERWSGVLSVGAELIVVSFVLMGFAAAGAELISTPLAAGLVLATVVAVHATMLVGSTLVGLLLRLDGPGRIGFTLVASQKTVAAGILVWQAGFPGNPLGPIYVVLHHLLQTVVDALLAPLMPRIRLGKRRLFPLT